jgi:hypothetical protein
MKPVVKLSTLWNLGQHKSSQFLKGSVALLADVDIVLIDFQTLPSWIVQFRNYWFWH